MKNRLVHRVIAQYRLRHYPLRVALSRTYKVAKTPEEILSGLNPAIVERASDVNLLNVRHNPSINQLEYTVKGKTRSQYTVMIRAVPEGKENQYWKSDVLVSCSCRHWRYGGAEHHAKEGGYLYAEEYPIGTLASPDIRDPQKHNYVCKHVYAALQEAKGIYFDMDTRR